jgi:hypothetical protein
MIIPEEVILSKEEIDNQKKTLAGNPTKCIIQSSTPQILKSPNPQIPKSPNPQIPKSSFHSLLSFHCHIFHPLSGMRI